MDPESGVHFQVRGPRIVGKVDRFSGRTMRKMLRPCRDRPIGHIMPTYGPGNGTMVSTKREAGQAAHDPVSTVRPAGQSGPAGGRVLPHDPPRKRLLFPPGQGIRLSCPFIRMDLSAPSAWPMPFVSRRPSWPRQSAYAGRLCTSGSVSPPSRPRPGYGRWWKSSTGSRNGPGAGSRPWPGTARSRSLRSGGAPPRPWSRTGKRVICGSISIIWPWAALREVSGRLLPGARSQMGLHPDIRRRSRDPRGTINPKGVPALYLALTIEGAVLEIGQGFGLKIAPCTICSYRRGLRGHRRPQDGRWRGGPTTCEARGPRLRVDESSRSRRDPAVVDDPRSADRRRLMPGSSSRPTRRAPPRTRRTWSCGIGATATASGAGVRSERPPSEEPGFLVVELRGSGREANGADVVPMDVPISARRGSRSWIRWGGCHSRTGEPVDGAVSGEIPHGLIGAPFQQQDDGSDVVGILGRQVEDRLSSTIPRVDVDSRDRRRSSMETSCGRFALMPPIRRNRLCSSVPPSGMRSRGSRS